MDNKPFWDVMHGDCRELTAQGPDNAIDAVITDPPYELGFMGKAWDRSGIAFKSSTWAEFERVMKPGAYLLAFGGTRTFHRIAVAIEDAGLEIRDCLLWLYGSGFPKGINVGKALDKMAGVEREVIGENPNFRNGRVSAITYQRGNDAAEDQFLTAPATDLAKQWDGWNTALKPAWEPIIVARKPFKGTVAANVMQYGTGAFNIDGSRVGMGDDLLVRPSIQREDNTILGKGLGAGTQTEPNGRWPANVILDEESAALLDAQTGISKSPKTYTRNANGYNANAYGEGMGEPDGKESLNYGDTGGASRFFYCAKASRAERNAGLDGMPESVRHTLTGDTRPSREDGERRNDHTPPRASANTHPTVKPIALMRYIAKLVTPPGGLILDPFCGSGSTGCAVVPDGFSFVGMDDHIEHVEIARRRIAHWEKNTNGK